MVAAPTKKVKEMVQGSMTYDSSIWWGSPVN